MTNLTVSTKPLPGPALADPFGFLKLWSAPSDPGSLPSYNLPSAAVQPMLRACRYGNTAVDALFYDVQTLWLRTELSRLLDRLRPPGQRLEPRDHGVAVPLRRPLAVGERGAVRPEDQRGRKAAGADFRLELSVRVEEERQALQPHFPKSFLGGRVADRVLGHRDYGEVFRQARREPVERRHLLKAWDAPRRPKVEHDRFSAERVERNRLTERVDERTELRRLLVEDFFDEVG